MHEWWNLILEKWTWICRIKNSRLVSRRSQSEDCGEEKITNHYFEFDLGWRHEHRHSSQQLIVPTIQERFVIVIIDYESFTTCHLIVQVLNSFVCIGLDAYNNSLRETCELRQILTQITPGHCERNATKWDSPIDRYVFHVAFLRQLHLTHFRLAAWLFPITPSGALSSHRVP